jgi:hypothetical protein
MRINGLKVVDAKKQLKIRITPQDIRDGDSKDPAMCAAALACKRDLKATDARVHVSRTYIKLNGQWLRFQTPSSLRSEVVAFDRGGKFFPGEYVISPMSPSGHLGAVRKVPSRHTGTHPQRKPVRRVLHRTAGIREYGANK